MPPKAKITKEMIIKAGFNIVRNEGKDSLNVRRVAAELDCSTQPIMYHYKTVDELQADIYAAADSFHTEYIMQPDSKTDNPMLSIGMNYIRFAHDEKFLFRFLFQSDKFQNISLTELIAGEGSEFLLKPLTRQTGLTMEQAREVFETLFVCVHGLASLLANNSIEYDEEHCIRLLSNTFTGIVGVVMKGEQI
ncbi:MAG: TetR/AcrR family transcriptional regulator [Oscillospiraceae bacterium]|nr:TetR/AcrR family transcriptional regulator [Oscillospiraceae bacterium]